MSFLSTNTLEGKGEGRKMIPSPEYKLPVWISDYKKWAQYYGTPRLYLHLSRAINEYSTILKEMLYDVSEELRLAGFTNTIIEQDRIIITDIGTITIFGHYTLTMENDTVITKDTLFSLIDYIRSVCLKKSISSASGTPVQRTSKL